MSTLASRAQEAAQWIEVKLTGPKPLIALVTGSGLGQLADQVEDAVRFSTSDVPHWPRSTVEGHAGRLVIGELGGMPILVMQGRVHFYEGYTMQEATFPIRVLQALGIERLILTNAAGGLEHAWNEGDIMLISDHINMPGLTGRNPLIGPNDNTLGPRFPNMTNAYSPHLREIARQVAQNEGITLREGVYVMVSGPSFETPAELRMLYKMGAHAVGMSTALEVVVARHANIEVLACSLLTNMVFLDPKPEDETSHEEVLEVGAQAGPKMIRLIRGILQQLAENSPHPQPLSQ